MCVLRTLLIWLNHHIRRQRITQGEAGSVNIAFHSLFGLLLIMVLIHSPSSRHTPDKEFSQCHGLSSGNCYSIN